MAGLGGPLAQALIGRAPYQRPPTLRQMIHWAWLRGGRTWRGAARKLGVSESTLRAWRKGGKISDAKLSQIRERTASARAEKIRKGNTDDKTARILFTFDGRPRDYPMANLKLARGTLARVQDLLMLGQTSAAVATFLAGIGDPWYRDHFTAYEYLAHRGASADSDDGEPDYDDPTEGFYDPEVYDPEVDAADAIDEDEDYQFAVDGVA